MNEWLNEERREEVDGCKRKKREKREEEGGSMNDVGIKSEE